jgi:hypothetical protein
MSVPVFSWGLLEWGTTGIPKRKGAFMLIFDPILNGTASIKGENIVVNIRSHRRPAIPDVREIAFWK